MFIRFKKTKKPTVKTPRKTAPVRKIRTGSRIEWVEAPDIHERIKELLNSLGLDHFDPDRIFCYRSSYANTRAIARIWGLNNIWQKALKQKPAYVLEVISEKFDLLDGKRQDEVLIHELAHIPANFSGALVPHFRKGKRNFHKKVDLLVRKNSLNKN